MYQMMELCNCKTTIDEKMEYLYRYFLLESKKDMCIDDHFVNIQCYGIEVVREKLLDGRIVDIVRDRIEAISPIKNKVINLIEYLKDNEVSPVHLVDVIGEYVDESVVDFEDEAKNLLAKTVLA
jgi:hypothetical protein